MDFTPKFCVLKNRITPLECDSRNTRGERTKLGRFKAVCLPMSTNLFVVGKDRHCGNALAEVMRVTSKEPRIFLNLIGLTEKDGQ
jgi:hypothetical protein